MKLLGVVNLVAAVGLVAVGVVNGWDPTLLGWVAALPLITGVWLLANQGRRA